MKKLLLIFTLLLWLPFAHANDAEFQRAREANRSGDYQTALTIYKILAEQGDREAQYNLALMYYNGEGVPQNSAEAFKWNSKSAEQGLAEAQYNIAWMYHNGEGVPKNYTEALKWYRKAAKQGYADAQYNLASMYYNGDGFPKNYIKAYIWVSIAIVNDNDDTAKESLHDIEKEMDSASIIKAQELATQCWESNYQNCGE